jgi:Lrp/AsnC family leucine-responsive transcriptional regulator
MKLDATDRRLLSVLQVKGRISNSDLADQVNMSASACHRRVGRLEAEGYIRDYVALVDPRKVDRRTTVFVEITLSGQTDDVLVAFEKAVALIPDVLECHLMAGSADYLLKVVAKDTDDFAKIHRTFLGQVAWCCTNAVKLCAAHCVQNHRTSTLGNKKPPRTAGVFMCFGARRSEQ